MKFSRAAGGLALLIVALPSLVGPVDAGLLLPLTAVTVGTGALATLGLLGAVGIGLAIKKSIYYHGSRGYGHNNHYHSHHHDHTGGGYGGAHTGGGYGGGHTGGGYGGGHTGGGYGGGHTGGGYGGAHTGGGYGTSYGGGSSYYPSTTYAAPLSSYHRRRRSLPVQTLVDNEQLDVDDLVSEDRLGCAQRLVCELAVRPIESLRADEMAVLALASAKTPKPGMKQLAKAAEEGKGKNSCSLLYKNCPFTAQQIMEIVRTVAEDY